MCCQPDTDIIMTQQVGPHIFHWYRDIPSSLHASKIICKLLAVAVISVLFDACLITQMGRVRLLP